MTGWVGVFVVLGEIDSEMCEIDASEPPNRINSSCNKGHGVGLLFEDHWLLTAKVGENLSIIC